MCRLAGRSDDDHAVVVAEWIATSHLAGHKPLEPSRSQLQFDPPDDAFRVTG
jgi:hypothetical protein